MHVFSETNQINSDQILPGETPLEEIKQSQDFSLDLKKQIQKSFWYSVIALGLIFIGCFTLFSFKESLPSWLMVAGFFWLFVLVATALLSLQKAQKILATLQYSLGNLYVYHMDKKHQTCGSMDPQETKSR